MKGRSLWTCGIPGDYALHSLPGSINIPIRKLPTTDMEEVLSTLPKKPIIAPCYDKRSCFYGTIIGLRLHRLGFDFRGRYTVPHEFVAISEENDFIERWQTRNERTFFSVLRRPLVGILTVVHGWTGNLVLSILLFVFALRFIFLPFGSKK